MAEKAGNAASANLALISALCGDHDAAAVPLRWRRAFPGLPEELSQLRRWLTWLLPECDERDDVLSVATELGSNALEHTGSGHPGGWFAVEVARYSSMVQLAVADSGSLTEPQVIRDADGQRGRGLLLVHGLSARTGWAGGAQGRLVWAEIVFPDSGPAVLGPLSDPGQFLVREAGQTLERLPGFDHLPAHCCCHVFTRTCPVDCLSAVLGTATFHALARAERAPFEPPATVGQVLDLWRAGKLRQAVGLGPRRLGEIKAALVVAGLALHGTGPS